MFSKIIQVIKEALSKITGVSLSSNISDITSSISKKMTSAIDKWTNIYEDNATWLGGEEDITSLGIAGEVCSELARSVTLEMNSNILDEAETDEVFDVDSDEPKTRAQYLNKIYHKRLLKHLRHRLEYGMAVGGMVIKPYINGGQIYFDYAYQGEFVPLAFDDDNNITDIAFPDSFISNGKKYTKIERQAFDPALNQITVTNRAFVSDDPDNDTDLGKEIELTVVPMWSSLEKEVTIDNIERPLYGYYRVPKANSIDHNSPLGVSVFSRAVNIIKKADTQFARLDWEYEAGQMALDVDPTIIDTQESGYYGMVPTGKRRAFRGINAEDMYEVFAPSLRDGEYLSGLNAYLIRIEDLCEISRGTISNPEMEARTATELKILKQRAYSNVADNQKALEDCLNDVIYAMNAYCSLYSLFQDGTYTVAHSWDDSIITDKASQLEEKIVLCNAEILKKSEVRAWYTGESEEKAQEVIDEIQDSKPDLMNDIFSSNDMDDSQEDDE